MLRIRIRVNEDHRQGTVPLLVDRLELSPDSRLVQRLDDVDSLSADTLHNLCSFADQALLGTKPGVVPRDGSIPAKVERMAGLFGVGRESDQRDPLIDLYHITIQVLGFLDMQIEDLGPGLVADGQEIAETFGNDQRVFGSFTFQQGISSYGGRESDKVWSGQIIPLSPLLLT